ncbi:MAG: hypothetical protein R3Y27_09255, partial [Clostridia bacterium]
PQNQRQKNLKINKKPKNKPRRGGVSPPEERQQTHPPHQHRIDNKKPKKFAVFIKIYVKPWDVKDAVPYKLTLKIP